MMLSTPELHLNMIGVNPGPIGEPHSRIPVPPRRESTKNAKSKKPQKERRNGKIG